MKKIKVSLVLLLAILMISGCSLLSLSSSVELNPPSWVIGSWSDASSINNYQFTSNNILATVSSASLNFKEAYEAQNASVTEVSNSNLYEVTFRSSIETSTYTFAKTSSTTLNYTISSNGVSVGPLQLTKQ